MAGEDNVEEEKEEDEAGSQCELHAQMPGASFERREEAGAGAAANRQGASEVQASRRAAGEAVDMNDFLI